MRIEDTSKLPGWAQRQIAEKIKEQEKKPTYADKALKRIGDKPTARRMAEMDKQGRMLEQMGVPVYDEDGTARNLPAVMQDVTKAVAQMCAEDRERLYKDLDREIGMQKFAPTTARQREGFGAKYGNRKTEVDGIKFDSKKEARRFMELREMLRCGAISDLRLQVDFTLQESYTKANGERVRGIKYRADFTYWRRIKNKRPISSPAERVGIGEEEQGSGRGMPKGHSERSGLCDDDGTLLYIVEDVKSRATKTRVYEMKKKLMREKFGIEIQEV